MSEHDAVAPEPTIPHCPHCGSRRVKHFGNFRRDGDPEYAWFQCMSCEHQWADFVLSAALLGIGPPGDGTDVV